MKVNVETPNTIGEEYSKLSPIDLRDEYIDDPFFSTSHIRTAPVQTVSI